MLVSATLVDTRHAIAISFDSRCYCDGGTEQPSVACANETSGQVHNSVHGVAATSCHKVPDDEFPADDDVFPVDGVGFNVLSASKFYSDTRLTRETTVYCFSVQPLAVFQA